VVILEKNFGFKIVFCLKIRKEERNLFQFVFFFQFYSHSIDKKKKLDFAEYTVQFFFLRKKNYALQCISG
jgi:hypothetical protein